MVYNIMRMDFKQNIYATFRTLNDISSRTHRRDRVYGSRTKNYIHRINKSDTLGSIFGRRKGWGTVMKINFCADTGERKGFGATVYICTYIKTECRSKNSS